MLSEGEDDASELFTPPNTTIANESDSVSTDGDKLSNLTKSSSWWSGWSSTATPRRPTSVGHPDSNAGGSERADSIPNSSPNASPPSSPRAAAIRETKAPLQLPSSTSTLQHQDLAGVKAMTPIRRRSLTQEEFKEEVAKRKAAQAASIASSKKTGHEHDIKTKNALQTMSLAVMNGTGFNLSTFLHWFNGKDQEALRNNFKNKLVTVMHLI